MPIDINIWVRHSEGCPESNDRYSRDCECPKHFQFQYPRTKPLFLVDGYKLKHGQNKMTANARSWSEAQRNAAKLETRLEQGIADKPADKPITETTKEWLLMREQDGKVDEKARSLLKKLLEFCEKEGIVSVRQIDTPTVMRWRQTLPYRTGDSSSLKVHWSVIGGFFHWCEGMGYIEKSPIPSARQNPQFKIKWQKPEVQVPTARAVQKSLNAATGKIKLMLLIQRWTGCAMIDAFNLRKHELTGNLIRRRRTKTGERYRVRIPMELADALSTLEGKEGYFFHEERKNLSWCQKQYRKTFDAAKLQDFHSHLYRHFRITEWLSNGTKPEDVAKFVGTSPAEIRKTYEHWIKETEDRLDEVQKQDFLARGLDENGNQKRKAASVN